MEKGASCIREWLATLQRARAKRGVVQRDSFRHLCPEPFLRKGARVLLDGGTIPVV